MPARGARVQANKAGAWADGELPLNIVFDLGGVVVRWEPEALLAQTFADRATRELVHREFLAHADWLELDRGMMTPADAVTRAMARTGLPRRAIADVLKNLPPSLMPIGATVELLDLLKARGHGLYCLSNMHHASIDYLERTQEFCALFTGKVISCRVNHCKPEAAIYAHLLSSFQLNPLDTVFIDDVEANLAAARRFGLRTILFADAAQCARELQEIGCL